MCLRKCFSNLKEEHIKTIIQKVNNFSPVHQGETISTNTSQPKETWGVFLQQQNKYIFFIKRLILITFTLEAAFFLTYVKSK